MALSESYKNRMKVLSSQKGTLVESARVDFLRNDFTERIARKYDRFAAQFLAGTWDKHKEKDKLISTLAKGGVLTKKNSLIPKADFIKWSQDFIFKELEDQDPSDNNQYLKWLINIYLDGNLPEEDFYKIPETLTLFNKHKEKLPLNNRNANNFRDLASMYEAVLPFDGATEMSATERERSIKLEGAEQVYEDDKWKIIIPKTVDAACLYGKSTRWCTASVGNNMFRSYNNQGPLYILIDKKEPDERSPQKKFQFHFPSNQFMDTLDRQIKVSEFFKANTVLKDFFKKRKEITPAFEFDHMLVTKEEGLKLLKTAEDKLQLVAKKGFDFFKKLFKEMGVEDVLVDTIINDQDFIKGMVTTGHTKDLILAYKEHKKEVQGLKALKSGTWLEEWILNVPEKDKIEDFIKTLVLLDGKEHSGAKNFAAELSKYGGVIWKSCLTVGQAKIGQYFNILSHREVFGDEGVKLAKKLIKDPKVVKQIIAHGTSQTQVKMLADFYESLPTKSESHAYYKNLIS